MSKLQKLYPDSFDWSRWRLGYKIWRNLGVACRKNDIIDKKDILLKHAIGYLDGDKLFCRPKNDEIAIMFILDDEFCWTHFRKDEFDEVFK